MLAKGSPFPRVALVIGSHLPELVLIGAATGFGLVLVELILAQHTEGLQAVAVVASVFGLVLCLLGLLLPVRWVGLVVALGLLLPGVAGPIGVVLHTAGEAEAGDIQAFSPPWFSWDEDEDEGEEEDEEEAPPLAPLSLSGLSLMAALGVLARSEHSSPPRP